jgi:hypothetical protein
VTQPLFSGGTCQPPGSITFNPLSADATNQDFEAILIGDCDLSWSGAVPPTPAAGGLRTAGGAIRLQVAALDEQRRR